MSASKMDHLKLVKLLLDHPKVNVTLQYKVFALLPTPVWLNIYTILTLSYLIRLDVQLLWMHHLWVTWK